MKVKHAEAFDDALIRLTPSHTSVLFAHAPVLRPTDNVPVKTMMIYDAVARVPQAHTDNWTMDSDVRAFDRGNVKKIGELKHKATV